jgi:hypothetical protein
MGSTHKRYLNRFKARGGVNVGEPSRFARAFEEAKRGRFAY